VDLRGGGLELGVAHERTHAEGEVIALDFEDIWDNAFNFFKKREIKVGLWAYEEFRGAENIS
jgi:hypothetical protein